MTRSPRPQHSAWILALTLSGLAAAQASAPPARHISLDGAFALVLPPGWRQLTPDEARQLEGAGGRGVPADLLGPRMPAYYPYGDVDTWLRQGFDGRCLTVGQVEGEPPEGDPGLAAVRDHDRDDGEAEWRREVLDARWTTLGDGEHEVIECVTEIDLGPESPTQRALELLIPTAGNTLILGFRAPADAFAAALPELRRIAATVTVARPARGPRSLGDHLFYPAIVGALVGMALLVLRHRSTT